MKLHYLKLTPQLLIHSILLYAMWIVYNWRSRPQLKQQRGLGPTETLHSLHFWLHTRRLYSTTIYGREHSSYELTSPLQLSERSTDIDLVREAVHQKRSLRTRKASETRLSRGNSRWEKAPYSSFSKVFTEKRNACKKEFNPQVDKRKHVNRWTRSHICRHYRGTA